MGESTGWSETKKKTFRDYCRKLSKTAIPKNYKLPLILVLYPVPLFQRSEVELSFREKS